MERTAAAGEYIARAGEPCLHWYGLLRGFLQMYVVGADGKVASNFASAPASGLTSRAN